MEPYNESITTSQCQDGTYLATVREIGINRELTTLLNCFKYRRQACIMSTCLKRYIRTPDGHADHALETVNGHLR